MKKNLLVLLLGAAPFIFSCKKEVLQENDPVSIASNASSTGRENCEPWPYGILGLSGGTVLINGVDNLIGDVGYSANVLSITNKNVGNFEGSSLVHSQVLNFLFSNASFQPLYGIVNNDVSVDDRINYANQCAATLTANYTALPADITLTNLTSNKTLNTTKMNTIVKMSTINITNKTLTLVGRPGMDDGFIINISGAGTISESEVKLVNIRPERVLFNFKNTVNVLIDRSIFNGTVLSRTGSVICFEPESFEGSIIAKNVTLFSYGSILTGGNGNGNGNGSGQWRNNTDNGGTNTSSCLWVTNFTQRTYCNGNQW